MLWVPGFLWLAGGLATAGCTAKPLPPLNHDLLRASHPHTLVVADARSPPITAEGPEHEGFDGRFAFGALGGAMVAASNQAANQKRARWMKGCGSEDPVQEIRETLAEDLAAALALEVVDSDRRTKAKDPEDVIKDYPGADLILDIRTSKWGIHRAQGPITRGKVHFAVGYEGSVRLIDARKQAVIAEGSCAFQYSNGDDPPTITELLEDDCALLDKGLVWTAASCTKRHRAALGLESAASRSR
jgi:hypothetical protein